MPAREGNTNLLSSVFAKAHSASALSLVSNQTVRGDDDYNNENEQPKEFPVEKGFLPIGVCSSKSNIAASDSSSEDSDEELNNLPQVGYKETSNLKNALLNVFSIKNRINGIKNLQTQSGNHSSDGVNDFQNLLTHDTTVTSPKTKHDRSSPNVFKKIISRKAMVPKMKAFKRIADDLEVEVSPLHDEIEHERLINSSWNAELFTSNPSAPYSSLLSRDHNLMVLNYDNLKKFEIINKANESWNNNRRKSSSSMTNESYKSLSRRGSFNNLNGAGNASSIYMRRNSSNTLPQLNIPNQTIAPISTPSNLNRLSKSMKPLTAPITPINITRKRKLNHDETDFEDYLSDDSTISTWNETFNNKRRLVGASATNSPKSPAIDPFPSRRNSVLLQTLQSASDSMESMSLK